MQKLYQEHGTKEEPKESKPISEESDQTIKLPPVPLDWEKNDPLTRAELYVKLSITTDEALQGHMVNTAQHLMKHNHHALAPLFMASLKVLPLEEQFKDHAPLLAELFLHHSETENAMENALEWLSLMSLEQKASIAPLILIMVDTLSLEAKQALLSFWYDAHGKDFKQANLMLGILRRLSPASVNTKSLWIHRQRTPWRSMPLHKSGRPCLRWINKRA